MKFNDITTRKDIHVLVTSFYDKIRRDNMLGPIFNSKVKDWDTHLNHLTTFWESNLFFSTKYFGNPLKAHVEVDQHIGNSITQEHFGHWLNIWIETIDDLYQGETAEKAKFRARKMSTFLYLKIFEARQN